MADEARGRPAKETPLSEIARLRAALRTANKENSSPRERAAIEAAIQPLIDRSAETLLRYCRALLRISPALRSEMEAADLAQDAWRKTLDYLAGERGERVRDTEHFERLLRLAARTRWLDALAHTKNNPHPVELDAPMRRVASGGASRGEADTRTGARAERLTAPESQQPESLTLPRDGKYLRLVEKLFTDPDAFHKQFSRRTQRQPRQYQALTLYQIGVIWSEQAGGITGTDGSDNWMAHWIRHYVLLLGIPEAAWERIEQAVTYAAAPQANKENREPEETAKTNALLNQQIMETVNEVCGTHIRTPAHLSVLRHDMNRFASQMT